MSGVFTLTPGRPPPLFDEPGYQVGEFKQISDSKQRAALPDDHLWIGSDHIGPLRWHRADLVFVNAEQEPRPVPVIPLADAGELSAGQRVKWVGHAYKARSRVRKACSSY